MMDEFITLLRRYDPAYPSTIRGASQEQVARFTELVGRAPPPLYGAFLLRMGSSMGSLELPALSLDLDALIETYESDEWRPPPRYILVALEMKDPYFDYYLDLESPVGADFGVVRFETGGNAVFEGRVHPSYHSFKDMLFSLGFVNKRLRPMPFQSALMASPAKHHGIKPSQAEQLATLEKVAWKLGFERLAHTGPSCLLLDREDAAIYGHLPPRGGLIAQVAGTDSAELSKISEVLRDHALLV